MVTPWVCAGIEYLYTQPPAAGRSVWVASITALVSESLNLVHWDYFKNVVLPLACPPPLIRGLLAAPGIE